MEEQKISLEMVITIFKKQLTILLPFSLTDL